MGLWFRLPCFWLSLRTGVGQRTPRYLNLGDRPARVGREYVAPDFSGVGNHAWPDDGTVPALRSRLVSRVSDELANRLV